LLLKPHQWRRQGSSPSAFIPGSQIKNTIKLAHHTVLAECGFLHFPPPSIYLSDWEIINPTALYSFDSLFPSGARTDGGFFPSVVKGS